MPTLQFYNPKSRRWEPAGLPTEIPMGYPAVSVQAYHSTTQSIATSSETALSLDSEDYDSDGFHSNSVNNSRLTVPAGKGGLYRISGQAMFAANATGSRSLTIRKNGTQDLTHSGDEIGNATYTAMCQVETQAYLSSGDYVELVGWQTSGGDLNVGSATRRFATTLTMTAVQTYPAAWEEPVMRSIGAHVKRTTAQSVPVSTNTIVSWSVATIDTDGFWSAALPTRLTIPANAPSGLYQLSFQGLWTSLGAGGYYRHGTWLKNGAAISPSTGTPGSTQGYHSIGNDIAVWGSPGDYFEVNLWQDGSGALDLGGTAEWQHTVASIAYLGSGSAAGTAVQGTEVARSTAQSIGASTIAAISFDTEVIDQADLWQVSPNPDRITVKETGWYKVSGGGYWGAPTTAWSLREIYLQVGSAWTNEAIQDGYVDAGKSLYQSVSDTLYLTAGEYVRLMVVNEDTAAKGFTGAFLRLVKMAAGADSTYESPVIEDAPGARVSVAGQSVAHATGTFVSWGSEVFDSDNFWSGSDPTKMVIPAGHAGRYRLDLNLFFVSGGGTEWLLQGWWYKNGGAYGTEWTQTPNYGYQTISTSTVVDLAVGDYMRVYLAQHSGYTQAIHGQLSLTRLATGPQGPQGDPGTVEATSGVTFPATQVPSTDPNVLDDYEEGTWTPAWHSAGGGAADYSGGGFQQGRYTKVGKKVKAWGTIVAKRGTLGSGASLSIAGLPFTADSGVSWWSGDVGYFSGFISFTGFHPGVYIDSSTGRILMAAIKDGTTVVCDATINMPTGSFCHIIFSVEYEATT